MNNMYENELSNILAKVMQASYRKKEINSKIDEILTKLEKIDNKDTQQAVIEELRREFEEIKCKYERM